MARKSEKNRIVKEDENFKTRTFRLEVYEDWEENNELGLLDSSDVLNNIRKYSKYIGIRHDKDEWSYLDVEEKKEYCDKNNIKVGDLKKPHYHFVVKFENARFRNTLAKEIGMPAKFIIPSYKYKKDVEYLIHLNEDDKYLYPVDDAFGTLVIDLKKFINKSIQEEDKSNLILDLIMSKRNWNLYLLLREINRRGLYSTFRSGYSIYRDVIEEHNIGIY